MLVEFQTTEGLTGLSPKVSPVTIDLERMTVRNRRALQLLVEQARFFELPARVPTPRGSDGRACRITIRQDDGREHTIDVGYSVPGPALQRLIDRLARIEADALRNRRAAAKLARVGPARAGHYRTSRTLSASIAHIPRP